MTTIGTVHDKRAMIQRTEIGEAKGDNFVYELSVDPGGSPVIRSSITGKYFTITWGELINLAIIAGINKK